jgi:hypothetical protein
MTQAKNETQFRNRLAGSIRALSTFFGNQSGSSFVAVAIAFPAILGMAALGFDTTIWYMTKRQIQTVADDAALVGTIEMWRADNSLTLAQKTALAESAIVHEAERDGFVENGFHDILVNVPPTAGTFQGDTNYIEVLVERRHKPYLSWMFFDSLRTIQARAVGGIMTFGTHCVVALDPEMDGALEITGTADITSDCGVASNSSSDQAVLVSGNASLTADPAQSYGDITVQGSATMAYNSPPQPLSERIEDPYAEVLPGLQADISCVGATPQNYGTADSPLAPGRFCGGISINGNVTFQPGTYYVDNGNFSISGTSNVSGDGVTFILTAMDAADLGTVDMSGDGTVALEAPKDTTEGEYPGLLFIQDPYVPGVDGVSPIPKNMLTGGTNMTLNGALYFPDQEVAFKGGTSGGVNCTLIVARKVTFTGSVFLDNDAVACAEAGVGTGVLQTRVRLFE